MAEEGFVPASSSDESWPDDEEEEGTSFVRQSGSGTATSKVTGGSGDNHNFKIRPTGVTTFGEEVVEHDVMIRALAKDLETARSQIADYLVDNNPPGTDYLAKRFVVAHFNFYCADSATNPKYVIPSEVALRAFSLNEGLIPINKRVKTAGLIDTGIVPIGMRSEAMETARLCKIPMLGEGLKKKEVPELADCEIWDAKEALANVRAIVEKYAPVIDGKRWLFVTRKHMPVADRCLKYLKLHGDATAAGNDEYGIKLAPLSLLMVELKKLCSHIDYRIPDISNEGHAERILEHPEYEYCVELACDWHSKTENVEAVDRCTSNIVKRMIYNFVGYVRKTQGLIIYHPFFVPYLIAVDVVDHDAVAELKKGILRDMQIANRKRDRRNDHEQGGMDFANRHRGQRRGVERDTELPSGGRGRGRGRGLGNYDGRDEEQERGRVLGNYDDRDQEEDTTWEPRGRGRGKFPITSGEDSI